MGDVDCTGRAGTAKAAAHPRRGGRRLAGAAAAAGLALCVAPGSASALPAFHPDGHAVATAAAAAPEAAAAKTRKRINRKVKVTGKFSVLPGSTFGVMSMTPDGVGHLKGARIVGRLSGRIVGKKKGLPKGIAKLLKIDVSGKLDVDSYFDPEHFNPMVARGLVAGRSRRAKKVTGCIRFSTTKKNGQPVQRFKLLGGTGKAAGYTMSGKLPTFSFDRPAAQQPKVLKLRVKSGKRKRPQKSCRRLLRKLKK
ncbi:MAG TPA: hypothetical protein VF533_05835 [Solirubrobacteraceae bacterium]|jgi:hypothetical protein